MQPTVSICCVAYNHERFIAHTLERLLAQKTDFGYEILIHDDASTDGTAGIIRRYAEQFPDVIKPIFQTENQYSKGVGIDPTFNYTRAAGKYIALCEGDDFWCDEHKLQLQVDYMEAHPDCTFCFTNAYIQDERGLRPEREFLPYYESEKDAYFAAQHAYTVGDMCGLTFVPTASFLFPTAVLARLPRCYWDKRCPHGDLKLRLFCSAAGYGVYLHAYTSVYRENVAGGAMSQWSADGAKRAYARAKSVVEMLEDVDVFSEKKYTMQVGRLRDWYLYVMLWNAPTQSVLDEPDCKRIFASLPLRQRVKFRLKHLLPRRLLSAAGKCK